MSCGSVRSCAWVFFFFFNDTATTEIYTLSLHDALPISLHRPRQRGLLVRARDMLSHPPHGRPRRPGAGLVRGLARRSEEHTSELQSPCNLVCRLLLDKQEYRTTHRVHAAP